MCWGCCATPRLASASGVFPALNVFADVIKDYQIRTFDPLIRSIWRIICKKIELAILWLGHCVTYIIVVWYVFLKLGNIAMGDNHAPFSRGYNSQIRYSYGISSAGILLIFSKKYSLLFWVCVCFFFCYLKIYLFLIAGNLVPEFEFEIESALARMVLIFK